ALGLPWESGQQHKQDMSRIRHAATYIVLTRDSGEGRISLDRQGDPLIHYWPNELDRQHLVRGMQEAARIAVAGGATAVLTTHIPRLALEGEFGEQRRQSFLDEIARRGLAVNRQALGTAHQMGTCRLGMDSKRSVADPYGEVYGTRGLFIGDASAFPSASGVNPMLTIMALAHRTARHIGARS